MKRSSRILSVASAVGVGLVVLAAGNELRAESAVINPMNTPNPMMPVPGQPMSPMSISPMQPLGGLAGQPETGIPRDPDLGNLPISPGIEDTYFSCTACHSTQTFAQMRLTDERWEYLWDWMIEEQGMPDYGEEARAIIIAYLQQHFSSER